MKIAKTPSKVKIIKMHLKRRKSAKTRKRRSLKQIKTQKLLLNRNRISRKKSHPRKLIKIWNS